MTKLEIAQLKENFSKLLQHFVADLNSYISTKDGQWAIKGFVDVFRNVYTISSDTKIVSKILEIHLFPKIIQFAEENGYLIVPADHQNYYPDISFVLSNDPSIKFAVDIKTTYRLPEIPTHCNGFTLGSHGEYFISRESTKNIQFPYNSYLGHFCLGIIYSRANKKDISETAIFQLDQLESITSVVKDFQFFAVEKWRIASDKSGSGNTANIGSIQNISDIVLGRGMFSQLGEEWFDDYWMNYRKITVVDIKTGKTKVIGNLRDFVEYRNGDLSLIVTKSSRSKLIKTTKE